MSAPDWKQIAGAWTRSLTRLRPRSPRPRPSRKPDEPGSPPPTTHRLGARMSAGHHLNMPFAWWERVDSLLTVRGLVGVLPALVNRPSRRAVDATAAKEPATGQAAVVTATASAFTEVTSGLREEIERLQRVAVAFEADLA